MASPGVNHLAKVRVAGSNPVVRSKEVPGQRPFRGPLTRSGLCPATGSATVRAMDLPKIDPDTIRRCIAEQSCPWCHRGPFKVLATHTAIMHGVDKRALRLMADLPLAAGRICSEEVSVDRRNQRLADGRTPGDDRFDHPRGSRQTWVDAETLERWTRAQSKAHRKFKPGRECIVCGALFCSIRDGGHQRATCSRECFSTYRSSEARRVGLGRRRAA